MINSEYIVKENVQNTKNTLKYYGIENLLFVIDGGMLYVNCNGTGNAPIYINEIEKIEIESCRSVIIRGRDNILGGVHWRCCDFGRSLQTISFKRIGTLWIAATMSGLRELYIEDVSCFMNGDISLVRAINLEQLIMKNVKIYFITKRPDMRSVYTDLIPCERGIIVRAGIFVKSNKITLIDISNIEFYYFPYIRHEFFNDNDIFSLINMCKILTGNIAIHSSGKSDLEVRVSVSKTYMNLLSVANVLSLRLTGFDGRIGCLIHIRSVYIDRIIEMKKCKIEGVVSFNVFPMVVELEGDVLGGLVLDNDSVLEFLRSIGSSKRTLSTIESIIKSYETDQIKTSRVFGLIFDLLNIRWIPFMKKIRFIEFCLHGGLLSLNRDRSLLYISSMIVTPTISRNNLLLMYLQFPFLRLTKLNLVLNCYIGSSSLEKVISPSMKECRLGFLLELTGISRINAPNCDLFISLYGSNGSFVGFRPKISKLFLKFHGMGPMVNCGVTGLLKTNCGAVSLPKMSTNVFVSFCGIDYYDFYFLCKYVKEYLLVTFSPSQANSFCINSEHYRDLIEF